MLKQLNNVQVWVNDQDEALAFYTEKLGLELRDDITVPEMGNFRWLSVGVPGQDIAITLMAVPGPPVFDEGTRQQIIALMSKGAASGLFFATDDCRASYEGDEGLRRRVPAGADGAALRDRRRLPRPQWQPDAYGAAGGRAPMSFGPPPRRTG
jgi:catechol 2,3-dioxygenase-like lactoylglutathione lyase family enzyme